MSAGDVYKAAPEKQRNAVGWIAIAVGVVLVGVVLWFLSQAGETAKKAKKAVDDVLDTAGNTTEAAKQGSELLIPGNYGQLPNPGAPSANDVHGQKGRLVIFGRVHVTDYWNVKETIVDFQVRDEQHRLVECDVIVADTRNPLGTNGVERHIYVPIMGQQQELVKRAPNFSLAAGVVGLVTNTAGSITLVATADGYSNSEAVDCSGIAAAGPYYEEGGKWWTRFGQP